MRAFFFWSALYASDIVVVLDYFFSIDITFFQFE